MSLIDFNLATATNEDNKTYRVRFIAHKLDGTEVFLVAPEQVKKLYEEMVGLETRGYKPVTF